jgi:putative acetyltransferase
MVLQTPDSSPCPLEHFVCIEQASASDMSDVLFVERAAFGQDEESELVRDLLADATARPLLSLVARADGRPVAVDPPTVQTG